MRAPLIALALGMIGCGHWAGQVRRDGLNEAIGEVLDQNAAAIEDCYQRALAIEPDISGRVVLRGVVMQDGHLYVPAARISDGGLRRVALCMLQQIATWRFPVSTDAEYVQIPLVLKAVRVRRPSVHLLEPDQGRLEVAWSTVDPGAQQVVRDSEAAWGADARMLAFDDGASFILVEPFGALDLGRI